MNIYIRKSILVAAALVAAATGLWGQQTLPDAYQEYVNGNIYRIRPNYCPYEFNPVSDSKAPKGFKPFYISHYGRHGSRSSWNSDIQAQMPQWLQAAKDAGLLTPAGDSLLYVVTRENELYADMPGRLTPRGQREHEQLAGRMYRRYQTVFRKGNRRVRAESSVVPRCLISMAAFTNGLKALDPGLDISLDTGEQFMAYIASDMNTDDYTKVRKALREVEAEYQPDTTYTISRIFTDPSAGRQYLKCKLEDFQHEVYSISVLTGAFDLDDYKLFYLLPQAAISKYGSHDQLRLYLGQCNSEAFGDLRMPNTIPAIKDFVTKADAAVAGTGPAVDLRFGHDFSLLSIMSFMGLDGVGAKMSVEDARSKWMGSQYTPFAANLQLIFYRNEKGTVLVKFLMNERETAIPELQPYGADYYYSWGDVRLMLVEKIVRWQK